MKAYYIMYLFGDWQERGAVEIIKFNQTAHGWHAVIRDMKDKEKTVYEMTIVPQREKDVCTEFPSYSMN